MTFAEPESTRALAGWLATFLIHSSLWIAAAWRIAPRVRSARWRARLWRGAALGGIASTALALTLATSRLDWHWEGPPGPAASPRDFESVRPAPLGLRIEDAGGTHPGARLVAAPDTAASAERRPIDWIAAALALWLAGALLGLLRLARGHRALARDLCDRRTLEEGSLVTDLGRLARRAGFGRTVKLSLSDSLGSPVALLGDEIVVPTRALRRLARDEQETLVAHELAHLVRRDPHWLLALAVLQRVFWFQPLLRLALRRALAAAELCCDDAAARWTGGGLALARCLAEVATWVAGRPSAGLSTGMAGQPSALVERVERLLAPRARARFQGLWVGSLGAALLALLACSGPTLGQHPGAPREPQSLVLAQRLEPTGTPGGPTRDGERLFEVPLSPERLQARRAELLAREPAQEAPDATAPARDDERVTRALEVLDDCPEAGIAFHVDWNEVRFARTPRVVEEHALELRADGSIWCGGMPLLLAGSEDERLLRLHLAEIARCMPKTPLSAQSPDGPRLPNKTLELRIDARAPHGALQHALEVCGRREVQIWRFSLVLVVDGVVGTPLPFALPRAVEASEGGDPPAPGVTEVWLRPALADGERVIEYELRFPGTPGNTGTRTREAAELRLLLSAAFQESGEHSLLIDAFPGTLYGDVTAVIDLVVGAGYTDIRFVGRRR